MAGSVPIDLPIRVIDDFLEDPEAVRRTASALRFRRWGVSPVLRHRASVEEALQSRLQDLIGAPIERLVSRYHYYPARDSWRYFIHQDNYSWSGVLYLSPDHDEEPGTAFYRHRSTGIYALPGSVPDLCWYALERGWEPDAMVRQVFADRWDTDKWDRLHAVPVRFNRLVFFPGALFHGPASAWGDSRQSGRLVQVFFLKVKGPPPLELSAEGAARFAIP